MDKKIAEKYIFRVVFIQNDVTYEVYAKDVFESEMFGFVVIEDFIFGEKSTFVVDPSEERLKSQFSGVKRTYIPMHTVLRIDEVNEKVGTAKITPTGENKVSMFPGYTLPPSVRDEID